MPFHIERAITITGTDAETLPTVFNFAKKFMDTFIENNPNYTSTAFCDVRLTIAKFKETRKWKED